MGFDIGKKQYSDAPNAKKAGVEPVKIDGFRWVAPFRATNAIPFGRAVTRGTSDKTCQLGGTGKFLGINLAKGYVFNSTTDVTPENGNCDVGRICIVDVEVSANVTVDSEVRYDTTTGMFGLATGGTLIENADYTHSADAGGLVTIELFGRK